MPKMQIIRRIFAPRWKNPPLCDAWHVPIPNSVARGPSISMRLDQCSGDREILQRTNRAG